MNSVWTQNVQHPQFGQLQKDISTDTLIIGGGMAGILCAYALQNAGIDCVLVEAKRLCDGITKNTTAKITFQHGCLYDKLIRKFGYEEAGLYLQAQMKACRKVAEICQSIDCDYENRDSYVYSLYDIKKIENETAALKRLGVKAEFSSSVELPFTVAGAVRVRDQAQFHPLKFAFGIAKDLTAYENTKVLHLMPRRAITEHGEISCKRIIIATHFPVLNKHGGYSLKLYQDRSYVTAFESAQPINGMYVDENEKGLSFRSYGDLLLLGGGSHRTGKQGGNWRELEEFALEYYPEAKPTAKWATQDCMSLDGIPYIGKYSKCTEDLYVATGFNKWGMSSSMVSAMILTDMIKGENNKYAPVFDPSRSMLHISLAVNIFESVLGILTPTVPRCPHLGCALKYNPDEHSWDCPCHGSRFSENGELIDNPATDDKKM